MHRVFVPLLVLLSLVISFAAARPALAHGLGQSYDLPLPLWLSIYGAAAAVLVSFVPISLLADKAHGGEAGTYRYPRFDLFKFRLLRAVLTNRSFLIGVRLLSVALFFLVVLSGLLGQQSSGSNFAPTFVWITWWVGFGFFTAFVGNVWPLVNPWKILFEWADGLTRRLGIKGGLELGVPYPAAVGVWPAIVFYAAFVWIEVVSKGSGVPKYLAFLAVLYSLLTWWGMVIFGKDAWSRKGEAFSVFFGLLGRFAPTEVRVKTVKPCEDCSDACENVQGGCVNCYECFAKALPEDRELNLRPPAVGLARPDPIPAGGVFFVILVLAGVTYDGLVVTPLWAGLQNLVVPKALAPVPQPIAQTLGLLALPLLFFAVYLGFVRLSQLFGFGYIPFRRLMSAYVYSLVPIAIAYQVAHYYTLFLVQGQRIIHLISDPFGWDWNLFGTAGYGLNAVIPQADFVWYTQVALIVSGHVVAVYLAHVAALRLLTDRKLAMRSQYPMLALMVLYTVFSLWILSQPVVEENKVAAAPAEKPAQQPPEELRQPPMPKAP